MFEFWHLFQEGLGALWTGLGPNIARNAIVNAAELASYDQVKQVLNEKSSSLILNLSVLWTINYLPVPVSYNLLALLIADNIEASRVLW